ncbi:rhodanese-like domain-containing protein [Fusibacter bizertensis]
MEILLAVLVAYVIFLIYNKITAPKVEHVSGNQLDQMIGDKANKKQFIDVRTPGEFSSRKVKGFQNIPLDQLQKRIKEIDGSMPVVVMCASGSRSMKAAKILSKNGIKNIVNVRGGISTYPGK